MNYEPLVAQLSDDSLLLTPEQLERYSHDATGESVRPRAVVLVKTTDEVIATVNFCREHGIPITTRGAGTGLSGGCVPTAGAIVLSTEQLTSLNIAVNTQIAYCGSGVITKTLQDEAAKYGLAYPPDPASYAESTIGGNVAEGAGGLRCKRFGVTKDYVLGLKAILSSGELLQTGIYADSDNFGLTELFVASEGTLGIVTEVAMRLIRKPERGTTILVAFPTMRHAGQAVSDINSSGLVPTVLEFLDGAAVARSNKYERNAALDNAAAILLIETSHEADSKQTEIIKRICTDNHCAYLRSEQNIEAAEELWKVRRNLSRAIRSTSAYWLSEDVAVPNTQFPTLVDFVKLQNDGGPVEVVSFGHAGDGNLHAVYLASVANEATRTLVHNMATALMRETLRLGGTITGEHGIGLAKKAFLPLEFNKPTLASMKAIKEFFDPIRLLNPDKIFVDD